MADSTDFNRRMSVWLSRDSERVLKRVGLCLKNCVSDLNTTVVVFDTNNIVLAEITAGLNFN
jgi:hypothetical protein